MTVKCRVHDYKIYFDQNILTKIINIHNILEKLNFLFSLHIL